MHLKRIQKTIPVGVLVLLFCAAAALGVLRLSIQSGRDKWCSVAQQSHPQAGDADERGRGAEGVGLAEHLRRRPSGSDRQNAG